jgi:hypothetical protein
MKTPSAGIVAELIAQGARPGFLVRIVLTNGLTLRLTTLDDGFSFEDETGPPHDFEAADVDLTGISWDGTASGTPKLQLGDPDLVYWGYATSGVLQDAVVDVWLCYGGVPGEAEPIAHAHIGGPKKGNMTVDCDLAFDGSLKSSPRRRVQNVIPPKFLLAPGARVDLGLDDAWTLPYRMNKA